LPQAERSAVSPLLPDQAERLVFRQSRPARPGIYYAKPWDAAPAREAVLQESDHGLVMVKCGGKPCAVLVQTMSQKIWWGGPV
jgi:hypothetical protein